MRGPCEHHSTNAANTNHRSLFVYPAQSNYCGHKYPLNEYIVPIKQGCFDDTNACSEWLVCVDAASYVSTAHLDLSSVQADFVPISFYKLFGFPTGLGALLVRNTAATALRDHPVYFGGGSVDVVLPARPFWQHKQSLSDRCEY
jgi:molybdenum cofactor sulfurtransferase